MQALLISTHPEESAVLSIMLKQVGFVVTLTNQIKPYIENWPDLVDLLLIVLENDHEKSLPAITQLRGHTVVPIIIITEQLPEESEIALIEAGVDLVVHRPFGIRLLITQIRALLRRTTGVPFHSMPVMSRGPIELDPNSRSVRVEDREEKKLTQLEFRLLYVLMTHANQIIPTENIVEYVWGYDGPGNKDLVRGLVQRLRSKVESDKRHPQYILTERSIGYFLDTEY